MLVCHRLVLCRLFGSLLHQELANLVRVADRFFNSETLLAAFAILEPWWRSANLAVLLGNRLGHYLDDSLRRLIAFSVDLSKVFDPCQVPLGSSRYFLRVPQQDRNPIDAKLR
jgi:hypothetical protein